MMKHTQILLAALVVVLVMLTSETEGQDCSLEQTFRCFHECKMKGHHGMCEWDYCTCGSCYYRACKAICAAEGRVGQCHDSACVCLG